MKRNGDVMRSDRLKQVMQQIDSSFDEKNVGKAKFSLLRCGSSEAGLSRSTSSRTASSKWIFRRLLQSAGDAAPRRL